MAPGLASPPARSRLSSLTSIHQRLWAQTKSIRDSFITCAPRRFLSYDSFTTNPGSRCPSHRAGGSLTSDRESGKDLKKLDSCRPIAPTSIIWKVMERLVTNRIRDEAEIRRYLSENHAAFRNGHRRHRRQAASALPVNYRRFPMQPNEEDRFDNRRLFKSVKPRLAECPPAGNATERCVATPNTMYPGLAS